MWFTGGRSRTWPSTHRRPRGHEGHVSVFVPQEKEQDFPEGNLPKESRVVETRTGGIVCEE